MVAKSPQPATREVVCTHCDHAIDIPATAMSVNCRYCHKRVIIEDVKIKAYHAVKRLATGLRRTNSPWHTRQTKNNIAR